jgi:nucleoside-diphosphate-sugar epimerase
LKQAHLVTGGTGFVGAALVLELLRRTGDDVVMLVRPSAGLDAASRGREALVRAAELYAVANVVGELGRCRIVAGDLGDPRLDELELPGDVGIAQVWHAAASLQFENRHRDKIQATNVEGTRRMLALAKRLGAGAFNYMSTAYVAGRRTGVVDEERDAAAESNNHYERSKIEAEALVTSSGLVTRILRPSIVVGHSRTRAATSFSGYYGFIRQVAQFRGVVDRAQKGLLKRAPVRLKIDPEGSVNVVSVDHVAREAVGLGLGAGPGVYHLTHPHVVPTQLAVRTVFELLELCPPLFVGPDESLAWLDQQLDKRLDFYGSYLHGDKRFARTRTEAALNAAPVRHEPVELEPLGRWYLQVLQNERSQLPAAR